MLFQVNLVLQKIAIQTSPKPVAVAKEHYLNNGVVAMVTGEKRPPSLDDIIHGVLFLDPKVCFNFDNIRISEKQSCQMLRIYHILLRQSNQKYEI